MLGFQNSNMSKGELGFDLRKPLIVLGVRHYNMKPIGVPLLHFRHEIHERVTKATLGRVELQHSRLLAADER